ncbi:hypothetical protein CYR52_11220 [Chimaeribacter arupi]|nr:hypothetical protein CYR52_11220 [Chimaeribacter arupi]
MRELNLKQIDVPHRLSTHGFSLNEQTGVWCLNTQQEFAYNDGDEVENYVLDAVTQARDLSVYSLELSEKMKDWPSTYHLISRRSNLLLPFKSWFAGKRVLEIGCGCGAITRFLGESCAEVVSVEGSPRRGQIARQRTRDLPNVTVISAPSDQLPDLGEFDAVLLIGVLEYANVFLGTQGQQHLLQDCERRLSPEGRLFVAIENKLGLKYFAGANEDHLGKPMVGINNAYADNGVSTLGRQDLIALLGRSGFNSVEEYLPLPDYKLPVTVVTPAGWQESAAQLSHLAIETVHQDPQQIPEYLFSLEQATKSIWENGLAPDLANSFLMVSSRRPEAPIHPQTAAYHYSDGRIPAFNKVTRFEHTKTGDLSVITGPMVEHTAGLSPVCRNQPEENAFIHGSSLWQDLLKLVNGSGWRIEQVCDWAAIWLDSLLTRAGQPTGRYDKDLALPAEYQDALPFNAIRTPSGEIVYFDLEWELEASVSLGYVAYRGIYHSLFRITSLESLPPECNSNVFQLTLSLMQALGFDCDEEDGRAYLEQDAAFMARIQNKVAAPIADQLRPVTLRTRINLPQLAEHIGQLRASAEKETLTFQQYIDRLTQENNLLVQVQHILTKENMTLDERLNALSIMPDPVGYSQEEVDALHQQIAELSQQAADLNHHLANLNQHAVNLDHNLSGVYASASWRATAPLRAISRRLPADKRKYAHFAVHKAHSVGRLAKNAPHYAREMGGWKPLAKLVYRTLRREGVSGILSRARGKLNQAAIETPAQRRADYVEWVALYDTFDEAKRDQARQEIAAFARHPVISVVMPTYNPPADLLSEAIESVMRQVYPHWELCIADDCSPNAEVQQVLKSYAARDPRIKICLREQNGHISAASNSALALASGEYIALLDHDDLLPENALFDVAKAALAHPDAAMFYSDEDKIDPEGVRCHPYFKPDWNPDLFLSQNMFSHLGVYKHSLIKEIGGFRLGVEGSQDYDLALRCIEVAGHQAVHHIPKVLYHWRIIPGSTAAGGGEKPYAFLAAMRVVKEHLERCNIRAEVDEAVEGMSMMRVKYALPDVLPLVSIIIPTRNGKQLVQQCIDSITEKTTYPNYEIILVDNGSDDADALAYFAALDQHDNITVLRDDRPFNYSALNNEAVNVARGELVCLLNNDIEVITPDWLDEMVSHAVRPEIGAVGARLWYPNDTLQHGGVILGMGGVAGHVHLGITRDNPGYFGRAWLVQNYSAVTAACLLIRKEIYTAVGGLEEENLTVAFNDVDFCIRVRDAGYRNLWTPFAELYHHESATRGNDLAPEKIERFKREIAYMEQTYQHALTCDPAFNPNFTLMNNHFALAFPPRTPTE